MIHTYRPEDVEFEVWSRRDHVVFWLAILPAFAALFAFFLFEGGNVPVTWAYAKSHAWAHAKVAATVAGMFTAIVVLGWLTSVFGVQPCNEIRLTDEGICEFETQRGVIRIHVNQINSVDRTSDADWREEFLITFEGGKVTTDPSWSRDFVARLKKMNPAVHVPPRL